MRRGWAAALALLALAGCGRVGPPVRPSAVPATQGESAEPERSEEEQP